MLRRFRSLQASTWPRIILALAVCIILPPFVSKGFSVTQIPALNSFILTHSIKPEFSFVFPWANLLMIVLLAGVLVRGAALSRAFSVMMFLAYGAGAFLQNLSVSDEHGFAITASTILLALLVSSSWLREAIHPESDFSHRYSRRRIVFLIPFAVLALWEPINPSTLVPDFKLQYFFTSGSSLSFCMTSIVSLAVLLTYFPYVRISTLQVTSLAGLMIGLGNLWLEFAYLPGFRWVRALHIPLVVLSVAGLYRSRQHLSVSAA